jgi:peptidoglycan/LPS O-acetylase OafA/YrhL
MIAYRARQMRDNTAMEGDAAIILVIVLGALACFFPKVVFPVFGGATLFTGLMTFILIVFGSEESRLIRFFFANPVMILLGTISYGVYLCHFPVIWMLQNGLPQLSSQPFLMFVSVAALASLISTATYLMIERPGSRFGQWIWRRRGTPASLNWSSRRT